METARTYRRRRRILCAAALCVISVLSALLAGTRAGADTSPPTHEVAPGETLWSVAVRYYPAREDPRVNVEGIRRHNGLEGYGVRPGMRLELPGAEG